MVSMVRAPGPGSEEEEVFSPRGRIGQGYLPASWWTAHATRALGRHKQIPFFLRLSPLLIACPILTLQCMARYVNVRRCAFAPVKIEHKWPVLLGRLGWEAIEAGPA